VPGSFNYTGLNTFGYQDYRDADTGKMLVAEPGGSYQIEAIDGRSTVPPPDGRWSAASGGGGAPPGPPPPPAVPAIPAPEGSDA
jgi:hypothetical protein